MAAPRHLPTGRTITDGPGEAELRLKALHAAGCNPGKIWFAVGAKAFNAPLLTDVAAQIRTEAQEEEAKKNSGAASEFFNLQGKCSLIMEWLTKEEADFADLKQSERKELITYIFKARGDKGAAATSANVTSACEFLESLPSGEIPKLLSDPPCLKGEGRVAKGAAAAPVAQAAPVLALLPPSDKLAGFEDLELDIGMLEPIKMPAWLHDACSPTMSETASKLVGMHILFKWPPRLGGWTMGTVVGMNEDSSVNRAVKR